MTEYWYRGVFEIFDGTKGFGLSLDFCIHPPASVVVNVDFRNNGVPMEIVLSFSFFFFEENIKFCKTGNVIKLFLSFIFSF